MVNFLLLGKATVVGVVVAATRDVGGRTIALLGAHVLLVTVLAEVAPATLVTEIAGTLAGVGMAVALATVGAVAAVMDVRSRSGLTIFGRVSLSRLAISTICSPRVGSKLSRARRKEP